MKRIKFRELIVLLSLGLFFSINSHATLITLSESANQTVDGEDFIFDFMGLEPSSGAATFILRARGDYSTDGVSPDEQINWNIDGIFSSVADVFPLSPEVSIINTFGVDDIEWEAVYTISAADINAILADGALTVFLDLSGGVNVFRSDAFVSTSITYDAVVSEPGMVLLFAPLAMALVSLRRRRRS